MLEKNNSLFLVITFISLIVVKIIVIVCCAYFFLYLMFSLSPKAAAEEVSGAPWSNVAQFCRPVVVGDPAEDDSQGGSMNNFILCTGPYFQSQHQLSFDYYVKSLNLENELDLEKSKVLIAEVAPSRSKWVTVIIAILVVAGSGFIGYTIGGMK